MPSYVAEAEEKEEQFSNNIGSLYGKGEKPIFSDRKAMRVNDLVTIVINESANSSSSGSKSLGESSSNSLGGGVFTSGANTKTDQDGIASGTQISDISNNLSTLIKELNKISNIGFNSNSSSTYKGSGTNTRIEKFSTNITARVIKIMDNNNYYIVGNREILVEGEKQTIRISGVIRADDISQSNTINSRYIADAKIIYNTKGDIHNSTSRGWLSKLVDIAWPF
jgi:flagellar L-ring protein precursor FlgH